MTAVGVVAGVLVGTAPAAGAAEGCTQERPKTVTITALGRGSSEIQLRANTNDVCAWGRIINGVPGDVVWVDRTRDNGVTWEQLDPRRIDRGSTVHTDAFNDQGKKMRACGHPNGYPARVRCTYWW